MRTLRVGKLNKYFAGQPVWKKELLFAVFLLLFAALRQYLIRDLPIMAVPKGIHDDWIMVHLADTLRSGQWLGEYNSLTLTKGMFFPLFLAVCNYLGIPYLTAASLFYTAGCVLFVYALRPLLKKYQSMGILYLALLWNPISYSVQAFQRVYRNSISYSQALFIFAGFLALYLRRKEPVRRHILWIGAAAVGTVSFFYTREDAIWLLPFLVVFMLVYGGSLLGLFRRERKGEYLVKLALLALPFLGLWGTGQVIAGLNEQHYGISTVNELQDSGFSQMYKSMMAVKPQEDIPGVTITREKIARMCDACPTLKELEPYFDSSREFWAGEEGDAENWEVRDGWMFWIVRTALEQAGYYEDGASADAVCLQIRDELESAMDKGLLQRQPTMPSTYMSPWRKGYLGDLCGAMGRAVVYTATYEGMETLVYLYSEPDENGGIPLFERVTGNRAIWYESNLLEAAGWYADLSGMEGLSLCLENEDGEMLAMVEFLDSPDIAAYMRQQGAYAPGMEKCRFFIKHYQEEEGPLYLCAYRGEEKAASYLLSEEVVQERNEERWLNVDWYWDVPERHGLLNEIAWKGTLLNGIRTVYRATGPGLAVFGLLAYFILCVWFGRAGRKENPYLAPWLVTTALLGSYLVLLAGISYSEISGWNAILYWYLSGGYPVMLGFEVCAALFAAPEVWKRMRNLKQHQPGESPGRILGRKSGRKCFQMPGDL